MTSMIQSSTQPSVAASDMVSVAERIAFSEATDLPFGADMNKLWFFLRNCSNTQVRREKADIYRILQVVGRSHALRMSSYMIEHAEEQALRLFWSSAETYVLNLSD